MGHLDGSAKYVSDDDSELRVFSATFATKDF